MARPWGQPRAFNIFPEIMDVPQFCVLNNKQQGSKRRRAIRPMRRVEGIRPGQLKRRGRYAVRGT
jgi:hypothetical protein